MKVLVAVKRVVDYNIRVRINADATNVDVTGVKMSINPFDENAMEEALRLKEKGLATQVVAVSLGTSQAQDVLRHALAMGADRAVLVETDALLQSLSVAKLLQAVIDREQPQLVIVGKQAIDDDAGQTGQMLAGLLGWPQGTFASEITMQDGAFLVTREIDGGTEKLLLSAPAVITADLRLNEPRFVKLPNLMMARKKPIETLKGDELGIDLRPRLKLLRVGEPPARRPGIRIANVEELVKKLRDEAGVLP